MLHRRCRLWMNCVIIIPAKLCNQRQFFSHDIELNNKGILHLHLHLSSSNYRGFDEDVPMFKCSTVRIRTVTVFVVTVLVVGDAVSPGPPRWVDSRLRGGCGQLHGGWRRGCVPRQDPHEGVRTHDEAFLRSEIVILFRDAFSCWLIASYLVVFFR